MTLRAGVTPRLRSMFAAVLVALAICTGLVAAASPAGAAVPPRTALEKTIATAVLNLLNAERALHGVPAVHMTSQLQLSARRHDVRMANDDEMSHQLPGEPWFGRRFLNAGYRWSWAGENIGWNSDMSKSGVLYLERIMYGETPPNDGHRLNILSTHYRDIGVDVYIDSTHHRVWLTEDFGRS